MKSEPSLSAEVHIIIGGNAECVLQEHTHDDFHHLSKRAK